MWSHTSINCPGDDQLISIQCWATNLDIGTGGHIDVAINRWVFTVHKLHTWRKRHGQLTADSTNLINLIWYGVNIVARARRGELLLNIIIRSNVILADLHSYRAVISRTVIHREILGLGEVSFLLNFILIFSGLQWLVISYPIFPSPLSSNGTVFSFGNCDNSTGHVRFTVEFIFQGKGHIIIGFFKHRCNGNIPSDTTRHGVGPLLLSGVGLLSPTDFPSFENIALSRCGNNFHFIICHCVYCLGASIFECCRTTSCLLQC